MNLAGYKAWTKVLCVAAFFTAGATSPSQAQDSASLVGVDLVSVKALSQTVDVLGRLVAEQSGILSAQVNGAIERINVRVGQSVHQGDLIATVRAENLRENRNLAKTLLAESKARRQKSIAELEISQQELKRLESLRNSVAFPQARFDDKRLEVAKLRSDVAIMNALIKASGTRVTIAELDLDDAEIKAPYDGVIISIFVEAGAYVTDNTPIIQLINQNTLEIEADVPSDRLDGLVRDREVTGVLAGGTEILTKVRAVIPTENELTRTQAVRFTVINWNNAPRRAVNQAVQLSLPVGVPRAVLSVHKDAVIQRIGTAIVYKLVKDDTGQTIARETIVDLGPALGARFEVLDGLSESDIVVTRGNERLKNDQSVRYEGM